MENKLNVYPMLSNSGAECCPIKTLLFYYKMTQILQNGAGITKWCNATLHMGDGILCQGNVTCHNITKIFDINHLHTIQGSQLGY